MGKGRRACVKQGPRVVRRDEMRCDDVPQMVTCTWYVTPNSSRVTPINQQRISGSANTSGWFLASQPATMAARGRGGRFGNGGRGWGGNSRGRGASGGGSSAAVGRDMACACEANAALLVELRNLDDECLRTGKVKLRYGASLSTTPPSWLAVNVLGVKALFARQRWCAVARTSGSFGGSCLSHWLSRWPIT